jgi:hypothetical protein
MTSINVHHRQHGNIPGPVFLPIIMTEIEIPLQRIVAEQCYQSKKMKNIPSITKKSGELTDISEDTRTGSG